MSRSALAQRMAACCRQLANRGLIAGRDGNVSGRLGRNRALVTPTGHLKGELRGTDMVEVSLAGRRLKGRRNPTSELDLHLRILNRRPEWERWCTPIHRWRRRLPWREKGLRHYMWCLSLSS